MTKQIIKIDASLLSNSACTLKQWFTAYKGYTPLAPHSANLVFGNAVHKFAEQYYKTNDIALSLTDTIKWYRKEEKTLNRMNKHLDDDAFLMEACQAYVFAHENQHELNRFHILEADEKRLVEIKFAIPFYTDDELEILLCGTIDQLETSDDKLFLISDIKTSQSSDRKSYLNSFGLSLQLMVYRIAVEWHATQYPDSIFAQILEGTLGCRIKGVFVNANKPVEVETSGIYYYDQEKLEEVKRMITVQTLRYVAAIKSGVRPDREGILTGECQSYGGCIFSGVCQTNNQNAMDGMLKIHFNTRVYDPLTFR